MAKTDRVTLRIAADYGRRCDDIAKDRRRIRDVQEAIKHPEFAKRHHQLLDELAAEYRRILMVERTPFLTIRVGTRKSGTEYMQSLVAIECQINYFHGVKDLILSKAFGESIPVAEEEIGFVVASNEELGFPLGCVYEETYRAALELGWSLCLASDTPEIRCNYLQQPKGEQLLLAMAPMVNPLGAIVVFAIEHEPLVRLLGRAKDGRIGIDTAPVVLSNVLAGRNDPLGPRTRWIFRK